MVGPFRQLGNASLEFGNGKIKLLPGLLKGRRQVMVVTGGHFAASPDWRELESALAADGIGFHRETVSGEPSPQVVDELTMQARSQGTDGVVAIGGGSVLDAGKAVAAMLHHQGSVFEYLEGVGNREPEARTAPMIAVPTTAGTGSEATKNAVISRPGEKGFKKSLRHDAFIPPVALIDPELAVGCPPSVSLACGTDAFSQLLESFVSTGATVLTDALARQGIRSYASGSRLFADEAWGSADESQYRGDLALAAYLSGLTLANAGLGTVHGIAGPLGAVSSIPHGAACGLLAPPVFRAAVARLRENDPGGILDKLAWTGAVLASGGKSEPAPGDGNTSDVELLLDLMERRAESLPKLSEYGIGSGMLDVILDASGNKNFPVSLDRQEMAGVLRKVL